jgi:hypothetical protein
MKDTQQNSPWKISFGKIIDDENKVICTLPNQRIQADANLIAAAPELMDLVLQAHERFTDNDMLPPNHKLSQWLKKAESLFAKVGGY